MAYDIVMFILFSKWSDIYNYKPEISHKKTTSYINILLLLCYNKIYIYCFNILNVNIYDINVPRHTMSFYIS